MTNEGGPSTDPNDPAVTDQIYLTRREDIIENSASHDINDVDIPYVEYNQLERQIWGSVFQDLNTLQEEYYPEAIAKNYRHLSSFLKLNQETIP